MLVEFSQSPDIRQEIYNLSKRIKLNQDEYNHRSNHGKGKKGDFLWKLKMASSSISQFGDFLLNFTKSEKARKENLFSQENEIDKLIEDLCEHGTAQIRNIIGFIQLSSKRNNIKTIQGQYSSLRDVFSGDILPYEKYLTPIIEKAVSQVLESTENKGIVEQIEAHLNFNHKEVLNMTLREIYETKYKDLAPNPNVHLKDEVKSQEKPSQVNKKT